MNKLKGKVAVITGGSTGIGFAAAKLFVAEGAHVYIIGRRRGELDAAIAEIGHNITGVQGDVSRAADLDRLYATVQQHHGRINVLFANAGISGMAPLGAITEEQVDRIFNIGVKGTLFTVQKALPLLQKDSSIILNGSGTTARAWPAFSVYSAAKSAIRSFARTWSAELLEHRIRVNAISPGTIDTPMTRIGATDEEVEQTRHFLASKIPMKRLGTTDEIAQAALFLASDESSFITGIELFVDGGTSQL
jgi:NAD(P)-dependent dehydrogenase (short-subunit alcohol dehydrogenase family)